MTKKLIIVCDDAGFASVDRGIRALLEQSRVPICADNLIETDGATERAKEMAAHSLVAIGIHFELSGISDADRVAMTNDLRKKGTTLGEQSALQAKASEDAKRQLRLFRTAVGQDPAHVGTHGDFHLDAAGNVMEWWINLMNELFDGNPPPCQWNHPIVRHNKYGWNLDASSRDPLTPEEFERELLAQASDIVEFVLHPALPEPGDASLNMLFTAEMRVRDLQAAINIVHSGCIERAGFEITPLL